MDGSGGISVVVWLPFSQPLLLPPGSCISTLNSPSPPPPTPSPSLPSRSLPRAEALAEEFPEVEFDIHLMGDLMKCVEECDVIFAASGSEELLVHREDLVAMPAASDKVGAQQNR